MSEDIFDAIIVGAGLAGSVAALVLAREGAQVLVIERGNSAGAKNVTGGRLYAHSLERIIPGFADQAPIERMITHEKLAFMTDKGAMTMDYCNGEDAASSQVSYSVLRSKFDAWLMEQAEEAGAQLITGIRVDNVVQRDGRVVGVEADGDILEAKVVILADGVNSLLAEKLGMAKRVEASHVAVGVKELIELPKSVIEDRFQLQGNEGAACLFAGAPTDGLMGGGFLYTNETTLSLGLVCGLHHLKDAKKSVPQMLEDFKQHPAVAPLIAGGKLVEYAAHVVPEAGMNMQPELVGDGVLIAGDAAGMCMNLGFTIRGMDLAISAGEAAAKTVLSAMKRDDFSKQSLDEYRQHLDEGPIFGPQIVGLLGWEQGRNAALGNVVISLFFMLGCIPAMFWLNSIGRRPLLIGSFAMMTIALALLGLVSNLGIILVVVAFAVYAFFSGGPGILQWLYPNELFPTDIRASAVGVIMSLSRIGTIVSTWALPIFITRYGINNVMLIGALISLVGLGVSVMFAPETRGLTLTQTGNMTLRGTPSDNPR